MVKKFRDPMSGLTHFIGIIMGIIVLVILLTQQTTNTTIHITAVSIFGIGMILLYTFSTLYHWLPIEGEQLKLFRKIDHIMIFVFIAASYTPISLLALKGAWGWSIFGVVWFVAIAGFFMKVFWLNAPRILYTAIYLLMGWIVIVAIYPLSKVWSSGGLFYLFLGGASYSVGAIIYALKKPNPWPNFFGFHEIFHVFIMIGSFFHFWMVYKYI